MKRLLISLFSIMLLLSTTMFIAGCNGCASCNTGDNGGENPPAVCTNHTGGTATCTTKAKCSECGEEYGELLPHDYKTLKNDTNNHWYECSCGAKKDVQAHAGGTATCTEKAVCSKCGENYGEKLPHQYTEWGFTTTEHWKECACGDKKQANLHDYKNGVCECGFKEPKPEHVCEYDELKYNDFNHWHECKCGLKQGTEAHKGGTATCTQKAVCLVCEQEYGQLLPHEYDEQKKTENEHWNECDCGEKDAVEGHSGGTATCTQKAVCTVCNIAYGQLLPHEYDEQKKTENEHWNECDCGEKDAVEGHSGGTATCTQKAVCTVCNIAYGQLLPHEYDEQKKNENEHWNECDCGEKDAVEGHSGGTATCTLKAVCTVCNIAYGQLLPHEYDEQKKNENEHWNECDCGEKDAVEGHSGGTATITQRAICSVCGIEYGELLIEQPTEGLVFTLNNAQTEYSVTDYKGSSTSVYVPTIYKGLPVTSIANTAFEFCNSVQSITFGPNSQITKIGARAFAACTSLKGIELPVGVKTIGDAAFHSCQALESIEIPEDVTSIGSGTFYECAKLKSVAMSSSVATIGSQAFYNCQALQSVDSLSGVTSIGQSAFRNCKALTSLDFTSVITSLGSSAFSNCTSLQAININTASQFTVIDSNTFYNCEALTNIFIPSSVTSIGGSAFYNCKLLKTVTIGNDSKLQSIENNAFYDCSALENINLQNGLKTIGSSVFKNCTSLKNVKLPASVQNIDSNAFNSCKSLTTIELSQSLSQIGGGVFSSCTALQEIKVPDGNTTFKSVNGNLYSKNGKKLIQYAIGKTETSFAIPNEVTNIFAQAFTSCENLQSIVIPNSVQVLGDYAFSKCTALKSIEIPNSVKEVYNGIFSSCTALETVTFAQNSQLNTISNYMFSGCTSLKNISLPNSVTIIGEEAFSTCTSLQTFVITDSVKTIRDYAFSSCSSLQSIIIPSSVTSIGYGAFGQCASIEYFYCKASSKPTNWSSGWNAMCHQAQVIWGY